MINVDPEIIAAKVTDQLGNPSQSKDLELLALDIANAASVEFLQWRGYEGLWEVVSIIRLSPKQRHQLKEHIKLIKIEDILRAKTAKVGPMQQEMFV